MTHSRSRRMGLGGWSSKPKMNSPRPMLLTCLRVGFRCWCTTTDVLWPGAASMWSRRMRIRAGNRRRYWRKRSEEHTSELQSRGHLVCRLLLEKKKKKKKTERENGRGPEYS